jgi:hypothetical protein
MQLIAWCLVRASGCPAGLGHAANMDNAPVCLLCRPGRFSQPGQGGCSFCPVGKFQSQQGAASCALCAPLSFAPRKGMSVCGMCPQGYGQPLKIGNVLQTPAALRGSCEELAPPAPTSAPTAMTCPRGYFGNSSSLLCQICPAGSPPPPSVLDSVFVVW